MVRILEREKWSVEYLDLPPPLTWTSQALQTRSFESRESLLARLPDDVDDDDGPSRWTLGPRTQWGNRTRCTPNSPGYRTNVHHCHEVLNFGFTEVRVIPTTLAKPPKQITSRHCCIISAGPTRPAVSLDSFVKICTGRARRSLAGHVCRDGGALDAC